MSNDLVLATDFGSVELTPELREAFYLLMDAAFTLQLSLGELAEILASAPEECPCCVCSAAAEVH